MNGQPTRGPATTDRARKLDYYRGNLIRVKYNGTGENPRWSFEQDMEVFEGLRAVYLVSIMVKKYLNLENSSVNQQLLHLASTLWVECSQNGQSMSALRSLLRTDIGRNFYEDCA